MRTPAAAEAAVGFEGHARAFVDELRLRRYAQGTCAQVLLVLPRVFSFLREKNVESPQAVEAKHLDAYAAWLARKRGRLGEPLSLATRSTHVYVIRRFFAFLERRGVLLQNPARLLSVPKLRRLPRATLSVGETRRLVETPPATTSGGLRDRAILELLYGTGLRLGECARLDVSDIDLAEGRLQVRDGKGRKDRVVPLSGRAREAVVSYLREVRPAFVHDGLERALFLSKAGTRLKGGSLYALIKGHARAAGLKASPHVLRHSCATHLLQGGADVRHIQALLGHSQLQTTALYTRVDTQDLRRVLDKCHPRRHETPAPGR